MFWHFVGTEACQSQKDFKRKKKRSISMKTSKTPLMKTGLKPVKIAAKLSLIPTPELLVRTPVVK